MEELFKVLFIFIICATAGYLLEVVYRSIKSRQFVNPGFLVGPSLPIYGIGGVTLYYLCSINLSFIQNTIIRIIFLMLICTIAMTIIEYILGLISLKFFKNRLWDYSDRWGNIQGLICPLFSLVWGVCCLFFYYLIYPILLNISSNVYTNIFLIFMIGIYFGIFIVDFVYSLKILAKLRSYAVKFKEYFNFENLKISAKKLFAKRRFFNNFKLNERILKFVEERKNKTNRLQVNNILQEEVPDETNIIVG